MGLLNNSQELVFHGFFSTLFINRVANYCVKLICQRIIQQPRLSRALNEE